MSLCVVVVMTFDQVPELKYRRIRILLDKELLSSLKVQKDCIVASRIELVPVFDGLVRQLPLRSTPHQSVDRSLLGWSTLLSANERQTASWEKTRHDGDNPCLIVTRV